MSINCMVCGRQFKSITNTHLATHGMDTQTYTAAHGGVFQTADERTRRSEWASRPRRKKTPAERFWPKVAKAGPDDHWLWKAAKTRSGYGKFGLGNSNIPAHRYAYILTHGPLPYEIKVCHKCDIPACCNPSHLFAGTQKENLEDMTRKGRRRNGRLAGEDSNTAKVTQAQVDEIRARISAGETQVSLAKEFGLDKSSIQRIWKRITWNKD